MAKCMRKQLGSTGKLKISLENTVRKCMLPTCGQLTKQLFKKRLQAASVTEMEDAVKIFAPKSVSMCYVC